MMSVEQKSFLNLGCGNVILPGPKPDHHGLIPDGVHDYPYWANVDKDSIQGAFQRDAFLYPWEWEDDHFGGALITHLVEHIPHEIRLKELHPIARADSEGLTPLGRQIKQVHEAKRRALLSLGDGFYAFFSELSRVTCPGALVHIIVPYAFSTGAFQDPTHTRFMVPDSFGYLFANADAPFQLPDAGKWEAVTVNFGLTAFAQQRIAAWEQAGATPEQVQSLISDGLGTVMNFANEFYVQMRNVK